VHIIKLPNPISKIEILKTIILIDSKSVFYFQTVEESDFQQSAKAPHQCCLGMAVTIAVVTKMMCMSRR
jgi:hypothetical protein